MGDCQSDATWRYVWSDMLHVCDAHMERTLKEAEKLGRTLPRARLEDLPAPQLENDTEPETAAHRNARMAAAKAEAEADQRRYEATKGLTEHDLKPKRPRPL